MVDQLNALDELPSELEGHVGIVLPGTVIRIKESGELYVPYVFRDNNGSWLIGTESVEDDEDWNQWDILACLE